MSARHTAPEMHTFHRLLARGDGTSDAQLLQRFLRQRDELAFEFLVWRHGPMVHGVCRRVLRDNQDAEDAFQATLLVLARKANTIGKGESVGGWLYKVAYRVALRARAATLRRSQRERLVPEVPAVPDGDATAEPGLSELRQVLDEELDRLAEKHRAPVVLCYLEGLTNEEAARQLGCPLGTVKTRLAQARHLLGQRLTRRGLTLAAALVVGETMPVLASVPPPALVGASLRAAASVAAGKMSAAAVPAHVVCLTEGVLRAMMVTKLKWLAVALVLGLAVAGGGAVSYRALAEAPGGKGTDEKRVTKPTSAEARVKKLKKQIGDLTRELRKAEDEAAREKVVPPKKGPVAIIFGDVPITRDEVAEHLLSRMTSKQLESYINRRILEHACKKKGIAVTAAEVDAWLKAELTKTSMTEEAFRARLREQHTTLRQWKEDVARPQLLLQKLTRDVAVSEKDIRQEYQAQYGSKVKCEYLIWEVGQRSEANRAARLLRVGEATFEELARKHLNRTITVHRTGSAARAVLEKPAFALKEGEVSAVIELGKCLIILKCKRHIPADTTTLYADVRDSLKREIQKRLATGDTVKFLAELKAQARPKLLWSPAP